MSEAQTQGSICPVANNLFGCNWKVPSEEKWTPSKAPTDPNTLLDKSNSRRTQAYVEALMLSAITNEIMDSETVVTYSNDGSAQSGVGSYVVQSFRINGKQRALPILNVFTESRESLKEIQIMTYKILEVASGGTYSAKDIVEKIDFVVTDSTSHNLGVMEEVCAELDCDNIPPALVCHVHPMMMFRRCTKSVSGYP